MVFGHLPKKVSRVYSIVLGEKALCIVESQTPGDIRQVSLKLDWRCVLYLYTLERKRKKSKLSKRQLKCIPISESTVVLSM